MTTRKTIIGLLLLTLLGAGIACADGDEDEEPPEDEGSFGRRDSGADDGEADADAEESDAGGDAGVEDTLIASEKEAKAKGWVTGCYKKPKTNEELLNSCAAGFREFDQSLYPASWKPGQLPALP